MASSQSLQIKCFGFIIRFNINNEFIIGIVAIFDYLRFVVIYFFAVVDVDDYHTFALHVVIDCRRHIVSILIEESYSFFLFRIS